MIKNYVGNFEKKFEAASVAAMVHFLFGKKCSSNPDHVPDRPLKNCIYGDSVFFSGIMDKLPEDISANKDKAFWQVSVTVPKDSSEIIEEFMTKSGSLGFHEVLYEEGKTDNLRNDTTIHYYYFAMDFPVYAFMPMALAMLGCPDSPYEIKKVYYEDFLKTMEETFTPIRVCDGLWIVPSWKTSEQLEGEKLVINPGFAFGTGRHATTQLMLEAMRQVDFRNKNILDMGSGSGVLTIYSLMRGAKHAVGIEVEGLAVESSLENYRRNKEFNRFQGDAEFFEDDFGWIERNPDYKYEIFLSNILPEIFYKNEKNFTAALKRAKTWMLSGIVVEKKDEFLTWLNGISEAGQIEYKEKEGWLVFYPAGENALRQDKD